jgi:DNA-binding IclR family transcriptional regulator
MIPQFWVSRALYVAANIAIPNLLADGPKSSEELAQATGTHPPSLYRLQRALDTVGVFAEDPEKRFALTPLGSTLRTFLYSHMLAPFT